MCVSTKDPAQTQWMPHMDATSVPLPLQPCVRPSHGCHMDATSVPLDERRSKRRKRKKRRRRGRGGVGGRRMDFKVDHNIAHDMAATSRPHPQRLANFHARSCTDTVDPTTYGVEVFTSVALILPFPKKTPVSATGLHVFRTFLTGIDSRFKTLVRSIIHVHV